jgi:hypothetical protein
MIKKLLTIAAVASAGLLAAPNADAGRSSHSDHTYRSGASSCGCPVYTTRFVRGYDCYRRPIFGYRQAPFSHGSSCRHRASGHRHSNAYHTPHRHPSRSGSQIVVGNRGFSLSFSTGGSHRGHSNHPSRHSRGRGCR